MTIEEIVYNADGIEIPKDAGTPNQNYLSIGRTCYFYINKKTVDSENEEGAEIVPPVTSDLEIKVYWRENPDIYAIYRIRLISPTSLAVKPQTQKAGLFGEATTEVLVTPAEYDTDILGSVDFIWEVVDSPHAKIKDGYGVGKTCTFVFNSDLTLTGGVAVTDRVTVRVYWKYNPNIFAEGYIDLQSPTSLAVKPQTQKAGLFGEATTEVLVTPVEYDSSPISWTDFVWEVIESPHARIKDGEYRPDTYEGKTCIFIFNEDLSLTGGVAVTDRVTVRVYWKYNPNIFAEGYIDLVSPQTLQITPNPQKAALRGAAKVSVQVTPVEYTGTDFKWSSVSDWAHLVNAPANGISFTTSDPMVKMTTDCIAREAWFGFNMDTGDNPNRNDAVVKVEWNYDENIFTNGVIQLIVPLSIRIHLSSSTAALTGEVTATLVITPQEYIDDDFVWTFVDSPHADFGENNLVITENSEVTIRFNRTPVGGILITDPVTVKAAWKGSPDTVFDTATVTLVSPESLEIVPSSKILSWGESQEFEVKAHPATYDGTDFTWTMISRDANNSGVSAYMNDNVSLIEAQGKTVKITNYREVIAFGLHAEWNNDTRVYAEAEITIPEIRFTLPAGYTVALGGKQTLVVNITPGLSESSPKQKVVWVVVGNESNTSGNDKVSLWIDDSTLYQKNSSDENISGGGIDSSRTSASLKVKVGQSVTANSVVVKAYLAYKNDGDSTWTEVPETYASTSLTIKSIAITIEPPYLSIMPTQSGTFTLNVTPSSYPGTDFTWVIVTPDSEMTLTPTLDKKSAEVSLDANSQGGQIKCYWDQDSTVYSEATITAAKQEITLSVNPIYVYAGGSGECEVYVKPPITSAQHLECSPTSGASTVLGTPSLGPVSLETVSGVKRSKATLTVPVLNAPQGAQGTVKVNIKEDTTIFATATVVVVTTAMTISPSGHSMNFGETTEFTASVSPPLQTGQSIHWTCSDSNVTLNPNTGGTIEVTAPGNSTLDKFTLTATAYNGAITSSAVLATASTTVNYNSFTMSISPSDSVANPGGTVNLTLVFGSGGGTAPTGETFTWTATDGTISGSGTTAVFTMPTTNTSSMIIVTCTSAPHGVTATATVRLQTAALVEIQDEDGNDVGSILANPGQSTILTASSNPTSIAKTWESDKTPTWVTQSGNDCTVAVPSNTTEDEALITVTAVPETDTAVVYVNWATAIEFDSKSAIEAVWYTPGDATNYPQITAKGTQKTCTAPVYNITPYADAYRPDLVWEKSSTNASVTLTPVTPTDDTQYITKKLNLVKSIVDEYVTVTVKSNHNNSVTGQITIRINWPTACAIKVNSSTSSSTSYTAIVGETFYLTGALSGNSGTPFEDYSSSAGNYTPWSVSNESYSRSGQSLSMSTNSSGVLTTFLGKGSSGLDNVDNSGSCTLTRTYRGWKTVGTSTTFGKVTQDISISFLGVWGTTTGTSSTSLPAGSTLTLTITKTSVNCSIKIYEATGSSGTINISGTPTYTIAATTSTSVTQPITKSSAGTWHWIVVADPVYSGRTISTRFDLGEITQSWYVPNVTITVTIQGDGSTVCEVTFDGSTQSYSGVLTRNITFSTAPGSGASLSVDCQSSAPSPGSWTSISYTSSAWSNASGSSHIKTWNGNFVGTSNTTITFIN